MKNLDEIMKFFDLMDAESLKKQLRLIIAMYQTLYEQYEILEKEIRVMRREKLEAFSKQEYEASEKVIVK